MFYRVFVIALVLLPFLAQASRICNNANVTLLGDEYFKGFNEEVRDSLTKTYEDNLFRRIVGTMFKYVAVANETCYHDTFSRERDGLEFHKLMRFSITHGFKGFVEDGGVACITAIKDDITKCVKDIVGIREGADDKYHTLWMTTGLDIGLQKGPCVQVMEVKNCTLNAIRDEGYYKCEYSPNVAVYVGSLFEYMLERCKRLKRVNYVDGDIRKYNAVERPVTATNILLVVQLVLVIILLAYIVIRDCRSSNTSWKLSELFTLRSRGQTGQTQFQNDQEN